jgi:4-hydroxythreonine-4-phosphate dehydrogenase
VIAARAARAWRRIRRSRLRRRSTTAPVCVLHIPATSPVVAGKLDAANGRHVLALIDRALDGCVAGEFAAMVTAPVQKSTIADAGVPFMGHTEYLAERTNTPRVVMLLVGGGLRVALATTHLPLAEVPRAITRESLEETLRILDESLRRDSTSRRRAIFVAGLNPHAGEAGYLGREEIEVIGPAIEGLAKEGISAVGAVSRRYAFHQAHARRLRRGSRHVPRPGVARAQARGPSAMR